MSRRKRNRYSQLEHHPTCRTFTPHAMIKERVIYKDRERIVKLLRCTGCGALANLFGRRRRHAVS